MGIYALKIPFAHKTLNMQLVMVAGLCCVGNIVVSRSRVATAGKNRENREKLGILISPGKNREKLGNLSDKPGKKLT